MNSRVKGGVNEAKEPLRFEVERISYWALDMDMTDLVLNLRGAGRWTEEEEAAYKLASKYLRKTAALHDERLSVRFLDGFREGEVLSAAELERRVREIYAARIAEDEARVRAEELRVRSVYAEAAKTGERQVLRSWMSGCADPSEECNCDLVTEYAMPDGSRKTVSMHTW
jgi:hypothetical protein